MEPWIALAEKNGCKSLGEAHYIGSDIAAPDMDAETYKAAAARDRPRRRACSTPTSASTCTT